MSDWRKKITNIFVEEVPNQPTSSEEEPVVFSTENPPTREFSGESSMKAVEEAYRQIYQTGIDIFIVEKLQQNFANIPEENRNAMVRSVLETMKHSISDFVKEANLRKDTIQEVLKQEQDTVLSEKASLEAKIEDAQQLIKDLSMQKEQLQLNWEAELAGAIKETERLENIVHILGGDQG